MLILSKKVIKQEGEDAWIAWCLLNEWNGFTNVRSKWAYIKRRWCSGKGNIQFGLNRHRTTIWWEKNYEPKTCGKKNNTWLVCCGLYGKWNCIKRHQTRQWNRGNIHLNRGYGRHLSNNGLWNRMCHAHTARLWQKLRRRIWKTGLFWQSGLRNYELYYLSKLRRRELLKRRRLQRSKSKL